MSRNIDWNLYIKRKDGRNFDIKTIMPISAAYRQEISPGYFFKPASAVNEFVCNFFTESYYAPQELRENLEAFTASHPEFLIQLNGDNDLDKHWRTNFADGKSEDMKGYIVYDDPEEVFY